MESSAAPPGMDAGGSDAFDHAPLVSLLDATFDVVALISMDGLIQQVRSDADRLLGYRQSELVGMHAAELLDPLEASDLLDRLIETTSQPSRRRTAHELRVRAKDGTWVVLEAFAVSLVDQTQAGGILVGCRNITQRKSREDHLRTLEKALQTTQIGVTITNLQGRIMYVNRAEAEMHGYTVTELLGKDAHILAPPHLRRPLELSGIRPTWARETENLHRDGSTFPVLLWSDIVTSQMGERIGFVTCSQDIREAKRVEAALRESEARFRGAFENAPIGIALVAPSGKHTRVNSALCQMTGYSAAKLLGKSVQDLIHPEDLPLAVDLLKPGRSKEGRSAAVEIRLVHREGHAVWALCTASPVRSTDRTAAHLVVQFLNITGRVQVLEALRASEARAAANFAIAPDAIIAVNEDRQIVLFNHAAQEMFGFEAAEILGESIDRILPDQAGVLRIDEGAPNEPRLDGTVLLGQRAELVGVRRGGESFPLEAAVSRTGGDETIYTLILRDITQRRAADEALRQTQQALEALVEASPLAIVACDLEGAVTLWNPAAERIFGWTRNEVLAGRDPTIPYGRNRDALHDREFAAEAPRRRTKFGRWIDVSVAEAELHDSNGRVNGYMAIISDMTSQRLLERERESLLRQERAEREQAEAARRRAAFLADAADSLEGSFASDLVSTAESLARLAVPFLADCCIVDAVSPVGEVRRVAIECVESEPLDFGGRAEGTPVQRVLDSGSSVFIRDIAAEADYFSEHQEHERYLSAIGALSLICLPLIARGRMLGVLTLIRTRASGSLYTDADFDLAHELARRAALTLHIEQLFHEVEASARSRDEVLAVVSHDLRNPLSVIQMSLQSVLRKWPPDGDAEPERKQLVVADRSAQRMKRLILDLLDATRIEIGQLALDPLPYEVRTLLLEVVELNRPIAEAREIELKVTMPRRIPLVLADMHRILQVFANLIDNATRFTPPHGTITIRAEEQAGMIRFSVSDTGSGMSAEELENIFNRFWRRWRVRSGGGGGLGLTIAKGIVEQHGGSIWASSAIGQGTVVSFTLPIAIPPIG